MNETINNLLEKMSKEIKNSLNKIDNKNSNIFIDKIITSKKVFVTGQGRSGLVSESFAMRLIQLGINAYHIGDCTTPAISKNDLLVAISGTGTTKITKIILEEAKQKKAKTILVTNKKTITEKNKLKHIDLFIEITAKTKKDYNKMSISPLGTLFEQASFIYLDAIIVLLMKKLKIKEKNLGNKHTNLE